MPIYAAAFVTNNRKVDFRRFKAAGVDVVSKLFVKLALRNHLKESEDDLLGNSQSGSPSGPSASKSSDCDPVSDVSDGVTVCPYFCTVSYPGEVEQFRVDPEGPCCASARKIGLD